MGRYCATILLAVTIAIGFTAHGQNAALWRKNISRTVAFDTSTDHSTVKLFDCFKDGVLFGKTKAYKRPDYTFIKLTNSELKDILAPQPDTIMVVDPVTGQEDMKLVERLMDTNAILRYRISEHWKFDPVTYKTRIRLAAISPVVYVYGEAGDYRGSKSLFWLMYDALNNLASKSRQDQQQINSLTNLIWVDYFQRDNKINATPAKHILATRTVNLHENEDTARHHLADESSDTLLSQLLIEAIQHKQLKAWDTVDYSLQTQVPVRKITEMVTYLPDTIIFPDLPITGSDTMKIITKDFNYSRICSYKLLEDWSFDPSTGWVDAQITAIAPQMYIVDDTGAFKGYKTMCWLRIEDVKNIIARYEEYHPLNTFAQQIWASYFLLGDKPTVIMPIVNVANIPN